MRIVWQTLWVITLLVRVGFIATLLALFARTFVVSAIRIPSPSMEPTLLVGDHILVNRFLYGPTRFHWERSWLPLRRLRAGDVIAFRSPHGPHEALVKRCVAVQGEMVEMDSKELWVDNERRPEPYVQHTDSRVYRDSPFLDEVFRRRDHLPRTALGASSFFALGDNRDISHDSRFWGAASEDSLLGRLVLVYWNSDPTRQGAGGFRLVR